MSTALLTPETVETAPPAPQAVPMATARQTAGPWRLLAQAAGCPRGWFGKLRRLVGGLLTYFDGARLERRLRRLQALGHIEQVPSRVQLAVGSLDMVRFWISPAAADYYASQGLSYAFHQVLRFLDEPLSLTDPLGLLSSRDAIIGHLMQVVHANPHYDLQLLSMFEDGLAELEAQIEAMLDGTHPRAASIGAIVEEPDYHARLLTYVRAFRRDAATPPPLRANIGADPRWQKLERTFGSLTGSMRYFCRMPRTLRGAIRHLRRVREFR